MSQAELDPVIHVPARLRIVVTLAGYGEKARAAAALPRLHIVPGKHFPQEDQAPAIAQKIAELAFGKAPENGAAS